jgi:hypothetical protein
MAFTLRVNESISLGGRSAASRTTIEGEGLASKEVTIAAAKTGQLTTRTDNDTGELTMDSGHGITTGARGMTVGTVATNAVPIDGGAGDNLPTNLTSITACVPQEEALAVEGDDVTAIEYYASKRGTIVLADGSDVELAASNDGLGLGEERSQVWYETRNPTNPLSGDTVAKAFFSNGDATASATLRVQCLYN